ncbi:unnamed protein product, partial [Prorocentrum cordatum]
RNADDGTLRLDPTLAKDIGEQWLSRQKQFAPIYKIRPACIHFIDADNAVRRLNLVTLQCERPEPLDPMSVHSVFMNNSRGSTDASSAADWDMVDQHGQRKAEDRKVLEAKEKSLEEKVVGKPTPADIMDRLQQRRQQDG